MNNTKEVRFDLYCNKCKHFTKDIFESEDGSNEICDDCLNYPYNFDSVIPVNYEPRV